MCSQYWNLNIDLTCPKCGKKSEWNLQTHFMGQIGSCVNYYTLDQQIVELKGVTVKLNGENDDFIGDCEKCGEFFDLGAEIKKGKVMQVHFLEKR